MATDAAVTTGAVVLEARNLTKHYPIRRSRIREIARHQVVHAVDDVSLSLRAGEVVAIVGESGSGKSTVGRLLGRLEPATSGHVLLRGQVDNSRRRRALRAYRHEVQLVFQDPFASLNPIHTVSYHLGRPLRIHHITGSKQETREHILSLLERVHLTPGTQFISKYPHELSGGQRQRIAVARALAVQPRVLLADEPVSMLDVSIRLSLLNLLAEIGRTDELALLYITHDIASARYFAGSVLVMYAGRLVEGGPAEDLTQSPAHPYTQLLLSAAPNPDSARGTTKSIIKQGEAPSMIDPPSGCRFHPRCPHAMPICAERVPERTALPGGRWAACWLLSENDTRTAPDEPHLQPQ